MVRSFCKPSEAVPLEGWQYEKELGVQVIFCFDMMTQKGEGVEGTKTYLSGL